MSKYDKEREALGLKSLGASSVSTNSKSKYVADREALKTGASTVSMTTTKVDPLLAVQMKKDATNEPKGASYNSGDYAKHKALQAKVEKAVLNTPTMDLSRLNVMADVTSKPAGPVYTPEETKQLQEYAKKPFIQKIVTPTPSIILKKAAEHPIVATGLGVADSATLGLNSKIYNAATGINGMEEANKLAQESHPVLYTAGEIGGYMIPGTGASKAVSPVVKAVGKKVASTIVKKAIEGGLSGATLAVGEGIARQQSPQDIAKNAAIYGGVGAFGDALIGAIAQKIKAGKALTKAEQEVVKRNPDFFATSGGTVGRSIEEVSTPPKQPLALPSPQEKPVGQSMIDMVRNKVGLDGGKGRVDTPFTARPGEVAKGNTTVRTLSGKPVETVKPLPINLRKQAVNAVGFGKNSDVQLGKAVWKNKDFDQPIDVIGEYGIGKDGRKYVKIKGSLMGVPLDEITYPNPTPKAVEAGKPITTPKVEIPKPAQVTPEIPISSSIKKEKVGLGTKLSRAYNKTVDNTNFVGKTSGDEGRIAVTAARSAGGTVEQSLQHGLVDMEGKKIVDKGINEVYSKLPEEQQNALDELLFHQHNIDRIQQGKQLLPDGIGTAESKAAITDILRRYPNLKQEAKVVRDTLDKLLDDWGVKSGLVSPELRDTLKGIYSNYVPGYRKLSGADAISTKSRGMGPAKIINTAIGSDQPLITLKESVPMLINKTIKAAKKNEVYKTILDAARRDPENPYAHILPTEGKIQQVVDQKLNQSMVDAVQNDGLEAIASLSDKALEADPKLGYLLTVMENGKPVKLRVSEDLFNSLKGLDKVDDSALNEVLQKAKKYWSNPFKALITVYNPLFAARNIIRDIPTAYIQGTENNPFKFARNLVAAGKDMATKADKFQEYKALGGEGGNYFNVERGLRPKSADINIGQALKNGQYKQALKGVGGKTLKGIGILNNATETLPRYAEYLGTLRREGTSYSSKMKGLYNAAEVTTNFGRHGDVIKAVDAIVPYLNPAVQGADKFARTMSKPINVIKALGVVTVPTGGFYLLNQIVDKKGYDQLDNRTKDTYFLIPEGNGQFIKLPKTREAGVLFGALFERIARTAQGQKNSFKGFGSTVATNFLPNDPVTSNIAYPAIQALRKNGTDFAGRDIVPTALQGYSPRLQYDAQTSEIAKKIGDILNLSPKKIDYLVRSYTGIIGNIVQPLTTASNYSNGKGNIARIGTSSFTSDSLYNNEIQNNFYNNLDKANTEQNDAKLTGGTGNPNLKSGLTRISGDMSTLRSLIKSIEADPSMTPQQKQTTSRDLTQQILDMATYGNSISDVGDSSLHAKYPELNGLYYPDNTFTVDKVKHTLSPSEYEQYRKTAQELFDKNVQTILSLPEDKQDTAIESLIEKCNKAAQKQFIK